MVAALKGISLGDIRPYHLFGGDLAQPAYPYSYIFIEPSYNVLGDYRCSTSQHPLDDVTRGEALIKSVYESLRNSAFWEDSLLILTWDEPGGFYDHAIPPAATPPGDTGLDDDSNQYGFAFDLYGPRVPAVIISPRIPKNLVDHRVYDHTSVLATVERLFGLDPLTGRDAAARDLLPLVTLETPRQNAADAARSGRFRCGGVPAGVAVRSAGRRRRISRVDCREVRRGATRGAREPRQPGRHVAGGPAPGVGLSGARSTHTGAGAIRRDATHAQAADFLGKVRAALKAAQKA